MLSNFTKDINAAPDQFLSQIIRRLVVHIWIVVHLDKDRPNGVQLAWRKNLGALDAKGDLKDVDYFFKGLRMRIAFHQFPESLEMVSYVSQGIAFENWVLTAVPSPL